MQIERLLYREREYKERVGCKERDCCTEKESIKREFDANREIAVQRKRV